MSLEVRIGRENIHLESTEDGFLYPVADLDGVQYLEMGSLGRHYGLGDELFEKLIEDKRFFDPKTNERLTGDERIAFGPTTDWGANNSDRMPILRYPEEISFWLDRDSVERLG